MALQATFTYKEENWDQHEIGTFGADTKQLYAKVDIIYSGELQGLGHQLFSMVVLNPDHVVFTGTEHIEGTLNGKKGSFMMTYDGEYRKEAGTLNRYRIVPGTGTSELVGITGKGIMHIADPTQPHSLTLEYSL